MKNIFAILVIVMFALSIMGADCDAEKKPEETATKVDEPKDPAPAKEVKEEVKEAAKEVKEEAKVEKKEEKSEAKEEKKVDEKVSPPETK